MTHKRCCKCRETKPVSEFYKAHGTPTGYQNWCKHCKKVTKPTRKGAGRPRVLTDNQIEWIRLLISFGKTLDEVVETTGFDRRTIRKYSKGIYKAMTSLDYQGKFSLEQYELDQKRKRKRR